MNTLTQAIITVTLEPQARRTGSNVLHAFRFLRRTYFFIDGNGATSFWYETITKNKLAFIGSTMLLNSFIQNFVQSGAFEIYYNGTPVYSKLESGKMPTIEMIIHGLERAGMLSEH